ncbi:unnamed protein product, partial [Prorocentrum cordatum]
RHLADIIVSGRAARAFGAAMADGSMHAALGLAEAEPRKRRGPMSKKDKLRIRNRNRMFLRHWDEAGRGERQLDNDGKAFLERYASATTRQ